MNQRKNKNAAPFIKHRNEADNMESEGKQFVRPKYIFHLRVLNCEYFVDHKRFGNDALSAYREYLQETINTVTTILKKRKFHILYVLSSSTYNRPDGDQDGKLTLSPPQKHNEEKAQDRKTVDDGSSPNMTTSNMTAFTPIAAMSSLSLNSPNIESKTSDDPLESPRIQHPSPMNLNKLSLKNKEDDHSQSQQAPDLEQKSEAINVTDHHVNDDDNHSVHKYGRVMIAVDVSEVIENSNLSLNTVVSIVSDEMVQSLPDGCYRLNVRFYPMYHGCHHRYDTDFFYHRGLSLRDEIMGIIQGGNGQNGNSTYDERNNVLMKSVLCLALTKQPNDRVIFQRFRLLKRLKDVLVSVHGDDAKYEIFGSMATKLDHTGSDLDVSVHLPSDSELAIDLSEENQVSERRRHHIVQVLCCYPIGATRVHPDI